MRHDATSIVIPVFNRAHLVHRAIDSALAQTRPCEVIVVDHGSTDGISDVIASYRNKIRYVRREHDSGPVAAWKDGIDHCTGEFVHITYDDDWIQPNFVERCLGAMESDVAFVYTTTSVWGHDGAAQKLINQHPAGRRRIGLIVDHLLTTRLCISPGCALFRTTDARELLLDGIPGASGIYGAGAGVGEDLLLFLLTSLRYTHYVHLREPLSDFLSHDGSITTSAMNSGREQALAAAYSVARRHYLAQPGARREPRGVRWCLHKAAWHALASTGLE